MTHINRSGFTQRLGMLFVLAFALTGFMLTGFNANTAQALEFPGFLEGPISDVTVHAIPTVDPQGRTVIGTVTVNGVTANVTDETSIQTPTRLWDPAVGATTNLSLGEISKGIATGTRPDGTTIWSNELPGRSTGFEGGTCLCETVVDDANGAVTLVDLTAEPAENVLIATVTAHNCVPDSEAEVDIEAAKTCSGDGDILEFGGTPMAVNTDPRIPSDLPKDAGCVIDLTGHYLDPTLLAVGVPQFQAVGEGYMGEDGKLYYYFMEIVGGKPLSTTAEVAISRARCRNKGTEAQYRVEGTTRNPDGTSHAGPVDVLVNGVTLMTTSIGDPLDPTLDFATWAVRDTVPGACGQGTATFTPVDGPTAGTPVSVTIDPDIR